MRVDLLLNKSRNRTMRQHLWLLVIPYMAVCFLLWSVAAWPSRVYGDVRDIANGEPVVGAILQIGDTVTHSDDHGRFALDWTRRQLTLTVAADGFEPVETLITSSRLGQRHLIDLTPLALSGLSQDAGSSDFPIAGDSAKMGDVASGSPETGEGDGVLCITPAATLSEAVPGDPSDADALHHSVWREDLGIEKRIVARDACSALPVTNLSIEVVESPHVPMTDNDGSGSTGTEGEGMYLLVSAPGYLPTQLPYRPEGEIALRLQPNTIRGTIRDRRNQQRPVLGATVTAQSGDQIVSTATTGSDGSFTLDDVAWPITLTVAASGYDMVTKPLGRCDDADLWIEPFEVRAVYMPMGLLTVEERVDGLVDLVDRTELNTLVIDVKNDFGWLAYPSQVPAAVTAKAFRSEVMDVRGLLRRCKEKGIYTIARLVLFKDSTLAAAYPEWAIHDQNGELWRDTEGSLWCDPFLDEVKDYNVAIAVEVALLGFDELQIDYVRFPSDGEITGLQYARESTKESRTAEISRFCAQLNQEVAPLGVVLSADLFGLTVWVDPEEEMGIGQRLSDIAPYVDYLSPMLYPSTFVSGNLGYEDPILHPYEVVYRSCMQLAARLESLFPEEVKRPRIRPWLQGYSLRGITYGVSEVTLQQEAADSAGTAGWMLWHAGGKYNLSWFAPASVGGAGVPALQ